jgi:amino acid adenylation domain-containing protein
MSDELNSLGTEEVQAFPASFAQRRLWFVDQLEPGKATYNVPYQHQVRLSGPLDAGALGRAVDALVDRHETLRTTFTSIDGEPVQVIRDTVDSTMQVIDLSDLPSDDSEARMQEIVHADGRHSFDLETGPLFFTKLIRMGPEDHVFIQMMSHIVVDGMSVAFIVDELDELYSAFVHERPSTLPEVSLQYADFVIWHRDWMESAGPQKQLEYWKQQLEGRLPALELPTDRPRPAVQSSNGSWEPVDISPALVDRLKQFSKAEGVSLFMTMLAAFNVLVHRYTRQDDILIGTPTANRSQPELEKLIAFFVNPVVMRSDLSADPVFKDFVGKVRTTALGAISHQDIPFDRLVEELHPERDLSRNPLFQVSFTLQMEPALLELEGTKGTVVEFDNGTSKFDLLVELWETDGGVGGRFEYNSDLFDRSTIQRMIANYERLLQGAAESPEKRVSRLPIIAEEERELALHGWNQTKREFDRTATVHEMFERTALARPESVAVECGTRRLTYRELDEQANQLARHLVEIGVNPGELVGLSVSRSCEMLVGLLGIMKAGAAYLPLDPDYPSDRLEFILADAAAKVLITETTLTAGWTSFPGSIVEIDNREKFIGYGVTSPAVPVTSEGLAYAIHTSGSTGTPKGVLVRHRNVVNFLESMRDRPGLDENDTLMAVTTLSFDIAALELYLPLIVGAKVVVAGPEIQADGTLMAEALRNGDVTVMQATPASWKLLLASGWEGKPDLRILCGGEELPRELAEQLLSRCKELWNMYGPTETTVWSAARQVESGSGPVPIGDPIANTALHVLDHHLQPVPIGVPGELCIGGEGVTAGYLNREELTADRFVVDPFGEEGSLLYRTGDLCRYRPDGTLEFLGRIDLQVKVRGFRIELGEVETVLAQHDDVAEAVVTAQPDPSGDNRLVGYILAKSEAEVVPAALREHLSVSLPAYMVPTLFVTMTDWPLTNNGKIDRRALPDPSGSDIGNVADRVEPRNPIEEKITAIWSELLGVSPIGVEDNFFELGGHSLLATQIIARVNSSFDVDINLLSLFTKPVISHLAEQVATARLLDDTPVDSEEMEEFVL